MGRITFNPNSNIIRPDVTLFSVTSSYSRNVNLALDTGASITSISPDSILGLDYDLSNPKAKGLSFTASGTVETKIITLSKLSAIGEIVDNIDVAIQEFPEQVTNQNIQGLLGLNFLRIFDVNMCFSSGFIDIKRIKR